METQTLDEGNYEYVETTEENEIFLLLQDLHRKVDSVERKFDQRLSAIEKGMEATVAAFKGFVQENLLFRTELKNAFKLTVKKMHDHDTSEYKLMLPCTTPKSVAVLEKKVRSDAKFQMELRHRLFDLGGKDWQAFVRRALATIWTNQAAENFSWSGQQLNIPVKNYKIILTIRDVAKVKFKLQMNNMNEMDRVMKRWFFYAGSRSRIRKDLDLTDPAQMVQKQMLRDEITSYIDPKGSADQGDDEKYNPSDSINSDPDYLDGDDEPMEEAYEYEELDEGHVEEIDVKPLSTFEHSNAINLQNFSKLPVVLIEKLKTPVDEPVEIEQMPEVKAVPVEVTPIKKNDDAAKLKAFRLPRNVTDLLPIQTNDDLQKLEILLKVEKYRTEVLDFLKRRRTECKEMNSNFSKIFTDSFLKEYSWNGKNDHKSLECLKISKLIIEAWKEPNQDIIDFEKSLRVCVFQSHTRSARQISNSSSLKKIKLN